MRHNHSREHHEDNPEKRVGIPGRCLIGKQGCHKVAEGIAEEREKKIHEVDETSKLWGVREANCPIAAEESERE